MTSNAVLIEQEKLLEFYKLIDNNENLSELTKRILCWLVGRSESGTKRVYTHFGGSSLASNINLGGVSKEQIQKIYEDFDCEIINALCSLYKMPFSLEKRVLNQGKNIKISFEIIVGMFKESNFVHCDFSIIACYKIPNKI